MLGLALPLSLIRADAQALLRASHQAPYGDSIVAASHQAPYAVRMGTVFVAPWAIFTGHSARCETAYDLSERDPVRRALKAGYSLLSEQAVYSVAVDVELVHAGRLVGIGEAALSCDEDSPVWIARIEIARLDDFALMAIGDALSLSLGAEVFALVVDGKTLGRATPESRTCEITASSPLALLDAPFAQDTSYQAAAPTLAEVAVEDLIGAVDWQLPSWVIPASALAFEGVTPLRAARAIVEAVGGLIESTPAGAVVCRPRHPVGVPQYGSAAVAHQFFDNEVLDSSARIAPVRGFNRVVVANERAGAAGASDTLEYVAAGNNAGTVRAYPSPARPVSLVHTGNPATTIAPLGSVARSETELAEFIAGSAKTRYAVDAITAMTWQAADLGEVTARGTELTATVPGYSLLDITYTVQSSDWSVGLDADEEVQFVLMDI